MSLQKVGLWIAGTVLVPSLTAPLIEPLFTRLLQRLGYYDLQLGLGWLDWISPILGHAGTAYLTGLVFGIIVCLSVSNLFNSRVTKVVALGARASNLARTLHDAWRSPFRDRERAIHEAHAELIAFWPKLVELRLGPPDLPKDNLEGRFDVAVNYLRYIGPALSQGRLDVARRIGIQFGSAAN